MSNLQHYVHMKTKILADFQICISVPLRTPLDGCFWGFINENKFADNKTAVGLGFFCDIIICKRNIHRIWHRAYSYHTTEYKVSTQTEHSNIDSKHISSLEVHMAGLKSSLNKHGNKLFLKGTLMQTWKIYQYLHHHIKIYVKEFTLKHHLRLRYMHMRYEKSLFINIQKQKNKIKISLLAKKFTNFMGK